MNSIVNLVIIDNRDSFTYNIYQYCLMAGAQVQVIACDDYQQAYQYIDNCDGIILSPGPGTPSQAVESIDVLSKFVWRKPILGICLGHQIIVTYFGGIVHRARRIMHGKTSRLKHNSQDMFSEIPQDIKVARYHSLIVDARSMPKDFIITAQSDDQNEIMGIRHIEYPVYGIQFHPEAIETEYGHQMIEAFIRICHIEKRLPARTINKK